MHNKLCDINWLLGKTKNYYQRTTISNLLSYCSVSLQLTSLTYLTHYPTNKNYQNKFKRKCRRCYCRSMIRFRIERRQTSTNDMLSNINDDVSSNYTHINNAFF